MHKLCSKHLCKTNANTFKQRLFSKVLQKCAFSVSCCKDFELLESAGSLSWAEIKAVLVIEMARQVMKEFATNWSFSHVEIVNASWFNSYCYCHMILVLLQSLGIASKYFNSSRLRGNCLGSSEVKKNPAFLLYCQWCSKVEI